MTQSGHSETPASSLPGDDAGAFTDSLPEWLAANYPLPDLVSCRLLRHWTNDVYLVNAASERYILKIYGANWRTDSDVRWETDLLLHLRDRGLNAAVPIPGFDSDYVRHITAGAHDRCAVLYEYAPGEKPLPPFTPSLYEAFGRAIARMHELSTAFVTRQERRPLDLPFLLDGSLETILPHSENPDDRAYLAELASRVKERITDLAEQGLDWGPIHGDASLDNLRIAGGEAVLYDFDSGGPGWRAADLQGWAAHRSEYRERWDAFHRGYLSVRRLSAADIAAAPLLTIAWDLRGIQIDLDRRITAQGREQITAYLRVAMDRIRERAAEAP